MERLSAADASFLYMENPVVHMHVTGLMILDPAGVPGGYTFDTFRDLLLSRLHLVPAFRRRLMKVPFGLDHPVWVDDPHFDIDRHLTRDDIAAPGGIEELAAYVGEYASIPLDMTIPLWEMVVVEGFADGSIAVVSKMHHVAVDGSTGTDMLTNLVDLTPEVRPTPEPDEAFDPPAVPSPPELLAGAALSRATDPLRQVRAFRRVARSLLRLGQGVVGGDESSGSAARPFEVTRTMLNRSLTARREVAMAQSTLDDFKLVKSTFHATVNDVFLAACTQSLREYLLAHGEPCKTPLVASVPVSVHGQSSHAGAANQVSNMFVRLPVDLADPVEQLASIRLDTRHAKDVHGAIGADMIGDVTELTPPAIFNLASRMYSLGGFAEKLPPIQSLVVSNVPGPPIPLYVAGARLKATYPFGPLIEGGGLNITVLSNMGNMDIGVIACPDTVPDAQSIAIGIVKAVDVLVAAAHAANSAAGTTVTVEPVSGEPASNTNAAPVTPAKEAPAKKVAAKKTPAKKAAAKKATAKKATAKKAAANKTGATQSAVPAAAEAASKATS